MTRKLGGNRSCIMLGLPTHLVQELNVGTVALVAAYSHRQIHCAVIHNVKPVALFHIYGNGFLTTKWTRLIDADDLR